jgi:hypothetical protein
MIDQQQILADQLRRYQAQAQTQAPQGRMAGRVYVAPNALEYLAAGLRGVGGMRGEQQTQQAMTDLQAKRQKEMAELLAGFSKDMAGTPYNPGTQGLEEFGRASIPEQAATPGDPMAAFGRLSASQFPEFQKMGMQGQVSTAQAQQQRAQQLADAERARELKAQEAERERQRIAAIMNDPNLTPQQKIAMGIPEKAADPNYGRGKISKQVEVAGPNGEKLIQNLDEFGAPIGQPIPAYLAPVQVNTGGAVQFVTPKAGASLPVGMTPSEKDASARGWAGQRLQRDRLDFDKSQPNATTAKPAGEKPLTESQAKGTLFLGQMRSATTELEKLPASNPVATAMTGSTWTNVAAPENAQKVAQLQNQWAEAYLRAKTGAAATEGEVEGNRRTFFPVVGDSKGVIAQKARMRKQAERDMEATAGPGASRAGGAPPAALSPEDAQAREWAIQNPNDPRAKQIMQRLGG